MSTLELYAMHDCSEAVICCDGCPDPGRDWLLRSASPHMQVPTHATPATVPPPSPMAVAAGHSRTNRLHLDRVPGPTSCNGLIMVGTCAGLSNWRLSSGQPDMR